MQLLTIDTSQGVTSLALWLCDGTVAHFTDTTPAQQAMQLVPQIHQLMQSHHVTWNDLEGIACITGTGGFTSVRIGIATARGLGFAAQKPVWGVSLLEVMAWYAGAYHGHMQVTCAIPAGHRDITIQSFAYDASTSILTPLNEMQLVIKENLISNLIVCAITGTCSESIPFVSYPILDTARLLGELLHTCHPISYPSPTPLYARPPDAIAGKPLLCTI